MKHNRKEKMESIFLQSLELFYYKILKYWDYKTKQTAINV